VTRTVYTDGIQNGADGMPVPAGLAGLGVHAGGSTQEVGYFSTGDAGRYGSPPAR